MLGLLIINFRAIETILTRLDALRREFQYDVSMKFVVNRQVA